MDRRARLARPALTGVRISSLAGLTAMTLGVSPAAAASVSITTPCVAEGSPRIDFSIGGFTPDAAVTLYDNTDVLSTVTVGGDGGFTGGFQGRHTTDLREQRTVTAADAAGNVASGTYLITELAMVSTPIQSATKHTGKVTYAFDGFIGGGTLYAHYTFSKSETKKIPAKTVSLGKLDGPCGGLVTKKIAVLPVKKPKVGVYEIQFDTSPVYKRQQGTYLESSIYVPKKAKKK